ncbi:hypothetical protein COU74_05110 [Candidatus Peregrinibacteria bacterium CG10_big_fil_rev_8_21_14_0_10_36_19]|nr:MAG: hypothetical protein COU74_05110 [Candidatus Peregrinibacteria bacterium CG10_big_fil_rev_8_21_14_0_10_36_19]
MTNREIHVRFCALGKENRRIVNELVAMLPEIDRLKIYKDYGCASVYEYACKYAGLSYAVVQKALWVEEKLVEAPKLKEALKEAGVHKVALFATIANAQNDAALADKVKHMSKPALQELSKELRGNSVKKVSVELDAEMQFLFGKIKEKLGIDGDEEALKAIFKAHLAHKDAMKQSIKKVQNIPGDEKSKNKKQLSEAENPADAQPTKSHPIKAPSGEHIPVSRYIPAKIRKKAISKTNGKCAYPNCTKSYEHLHHQDYFAHTRNHKNLIPLCKIHHEFMHNGVVAVENEPKKWRIDLGGKICKFDVEYRRARQNK